MHIYEVFIYNPYSVPGVYLNNISVKDPDELNSDSKMRMAFSSFCVVRIIDNLVKPSSSNKPTKQSKE